jgi:hypothetical protein
MAAQGFVAKTSAEAKVDSAETTRVRRSKGIILQDSAPTTPEAWCLRPHSFVILRPANPDYTARDMVAARFMPPYRGLKDKCIQTH